MQRRDFIKRAVQAGAIIPLASSGLFARPLSYSFFPRPADIGDRVLVLINLSGGNDGLNTVVPVNDQVYYDSRSDIALPANQTLSLGNGLGLHNAMQGIHTLYNSGSCAVINNVGYPNQNRSHFRSTDIWHTASGADELLFTGWLGRYLESVHPEYPQVLPQAPFAMQISASTTLALQGVTGKMGIAVDNPDRFYSLANGLSVDPEPVPNTLAGPELEFVRSVIQQSNSFSTEIDNAIASGANAAQYANDQLSNQLKAVARLINGGLSTGIYIVSMAGFDTHSLQLPIHAQLLTALSSSVSSFMQDIAASGNADRVVCMSYSEFGRRLNQNGSQGTDHGAAAPQFVFGNPVLGGKVIGGLPNLVNLDDRGDIEFTVDFRQLYATILQDWLGLSATSSRSLLGNDFTKLPLFATSGIRYNDDAVPFGMALEQNAPNPVSTQTSISFHLPAQSYVRLTVVSTDGQTVQTLVNKRLEEGPHTVQMNASLLPAGAYIYTLQAGQHRLSRSMTVVR